MREYKIDLVNDRKGYRGWEGGERDVFLFLFLFGKFVRVAINPSNLYNL